MPDNISKDFIFTPEKLSELVKDLESKLSRLEQEIFFLKFEIRWLELQLERKKVKILLRKYVKKKFKGDFMFTDEDESFSIEGFEDEEDENLSLAEAWARYERKQYDPREDQ